MPSQNIAVVVTTIMQPTEQLRALDNGCTQRGWSLVVVGDRKSPAGFRLPGAKYYSLADQRSLDLQYGRVCPENTYARKNLGYLIAMSQGADIIIETDDDNEPLPGFWNERRQDARAPLIRDKGWMNVYTEIGADRFCWPRGYPLDLINNAAQPLHLPADSETNCPIQQGLADLNPDLDAVYRLTRELPIRFEPGKQLILGEGVWSPFNSQNTTWFSDAFALMYLPAFCSFRMTDIWRSLVAQRICWSNAWRVMYGSPTMAQVRNSHNLMQDFREELAGYLKSGELARSLEGLELPSGREKMADALRLCYDAMTRSQAVEDSERGLLEAWLTDYQAFQADRPR